MKILLVDDNDSLRLILGKLLEEYGHEVIGADTGTRALEIIQIRHVDLVLTDMNMPGQSGLDTIRCIRQQNPDLPIIAMSGESGPHQEPSKQAGALAFLKKPFSGKELHAILERCRCQVLA